VRLDSSKLSKKDFKLLNPLLPKQPQFKLKPLLLPNQLQLSRRPQLRDLLLRTLEISSGPLRTTTVRISILKVRRWSISLLCTSSSLAKTL
jgi:hypothetical protein